MAEKIQFEFACKTCGKLLPHTQALQNIVARIVQSEDIKSQTEKNAYAWKAKKSKSITVKTCLCKKIYHSPMLPLYLAFHALCYTNYLKIER